MSAQRRVASERSDRVSAIRALHARNGRRKAGRFVVEGPLAVGEALAASAAVIDVFIDESRADVADIAGRAKAAGAAVVLVDPGVMAAMSDTEHPQGVLAVCSLPGRTDEDLDSLMSRSGPVIVLDEVGDPGNVGTVIRTADAVGAAGIVLTPGSADPYGGKVVRSTAGSLFHLPVLTDRTIDDVADAAQAADRTLAVTAGEGVVDLFDAVRTARVGARTVWVVGSEARGASVTARERADVTVSIPMAGRAESLNAGVACAVVLYVAQFGAARADFGANSDE